MTSRTPSSWRWIRCGREDGLAIVFTSSGDNPALSKSYRNISELRHQMFDHSLSARRQIDAVLTKEQREKLNHG